jgi:hypothetical protein
MGSREKVREATKLAAARFKPEHCGGGPREGGDPLLILSLSRKLSRYTMEAKRLLVFLVF